MSNSKRLAGQKPACAAEVSKVAYPHDEDEIMLSIGLIDVQPSRTLSGSLMRLFPFNKSTYCKQHGSKLNQAPCLLSEQFMSTIGECPCVQCPLHLKLPPTISGPQRVE